MERTAGSSSTRFCLRGQSGAARGTRLEGTSWGDAAAADDDGEDDEAAALTAPLLGVSRDADVVDVDDDAAAADDDDDDAENVPYDDDDDDDDAENVPYDDARELLSLIHI